MLVRTQHFDYIHRSTAQTMKTLRKWIRDLFGFSGREVNGFLILLPLMLILVVAMPMYTSWKSRRTDDFSREVRVLDSLLAFWEKERSDETPMVPAREFFTFDPNLASEDDLRRLGFTVTLAKRIASYRQKGGQFRVKSDLLKIYGVDSTFYEQLRAYIRLPDKIDYKRREAKTTTTATATNARSATRTQFDLNTADTTILKSVYGIGPVLASRIVRFRERLGGFVRPEQLREVYGLDSATVARILEVAFITGDFMPTKININHAGEEELARHPYISKSMARAIVTYRFQHGTFGSPEELLNFPQIKAENAARAMPYLTTEDQ